jgi:hypothetical protein
MSPSGSPVADTETNYTLTSLFTFEKRFVIQPAHCEEALQMLDDPLDS